MLELPVPKQTRLRPRVTLLGSFNRFLTEIRLTIEELSDEGAEVLSPRGALPWREPLPGFLLVEGDRVLPHRSVRMIEDRHCACIARSEFVVLVCPDGYVGPSAGFEMGVALGSDVPIYGTTLPTSLKVACHVHLVPQLKLAVLNHRTALL